MKVLGIIVEFNPLHHGHLHFLNEAKKIVCPDITIAVVSNYFSMRGDIMVMDKKTKTQLMLDVGIDLVLELPFISSTQSADYFALHSIQILNHFGVTDIVFGSESGDLDIIHQTIEVSESKDFQTRIKQYLDQGLSYPASHYEVIKSLTDNFELTNAYSKPNQILGLQYVKSIKKINPNIRVHTIPRIIASYHEPVPHHETITSATAIRNLMIHDEDINAYIGFDQTKYPMVDLRVATAHLFLLLKYELDRKRDYTGILGVTEGIENRLIKLIKNANSYEELLNKATTKRYTTSRIKRTLLYILFDISSQYYHQEPFYLRILGMNDSGMNYINTLPKATKANLITNIQNQSNPLLDIELQVASVYGMITNQHEPIKFEYQYPITKKEGIHYDSKRN